MDTTQPGADNALDLDKLEALARAANKGNGLATADYIGAVHPAAVLALIALARRAAQPVEAPTPVSLWDCRHPDDHAVLRFAAAMIRKMAVSREKGRHGWNDESICPTERLQGMLLDHLAKGDPLDVANFCMMLWTRNASVAATHPSEPAVPTVAARADAIVTALYRRFKDWSKRGFGPDDVTWCEVKADVLALIAAELAVPAVGGEIVAMPRIPTEEMLNAARDWSVKKYGIGVGNDAAIGCWQAMHDAAPAGALVAMPEPNDELRDQIGQAIADYAAEHMNPGGQVGIDWCSANDIDPLADKIVALIPAAAPTGSAAAPAEHVYQVELDADAGRWLDVKESEVPTWRRKKFNVRALLATLPIPTKGNEDTDTGEGK